MPIFFWIQFDGIHFFKRIFLRFLPSQGHKTKKHCRFFFPPAHLAQICTCPCTRLLLALVQGFCQSLAALVQSYCGFPLPLPLGLFFPIRASLYGVSSITGSSLGSSFALLFGLAPLTWPLPCFGGCLASDEPDSSSESSEPSVWVPWSWLLCCCCPCSRPEVLLLGPGRQTT